MTLGTETREEIRDLKSKGFSYEQIARRLGISSSTAHAVCNSQSAQEAKEYAKANDTSNTSKLRKTELPDNDPKLMTI